jgi:hypothetical protein
MGTLEYFQWLAERDGARGAPHKFQAAYAAMGAHEDAF